MQNKSKRSETKDAINQDKGDLIIRSTIKYTNMFHLKLNIIVKIVYFMLFIVCRKKFIVAFKLNFLL